ncbi:MAG: metal-dependent transcriptional regulator [Bifidobacterium sp.]|jgi:DtxR family Mn-dependent transcriptional regulator|nr:metal-dependent transcriptional regulator [Bifidobacterium sp.]MCI1864974.1 metal-dependent transcriptional regulator [Bifidobacterium sp.]
MTLNDLSPNAQDYLKVIWGLHDWGQSAVQPSDLANKAGVKPSTISGAVAKLVAGGYATHDPYGAIELTASGTRFALRMVRKHRLLETFLVSTLKYGWDEVHTEADSLEHAASDMMIDRIDDLLGHPTTDPHGDPIPQPDGTVPPVSSLPLARASEGSLVRIDRVSDEDPQLLRYLETHKVSIGSTVLVGERGPYSDGTTVTPQVQEHPDEPDESESITLSAVASNQIRISLVSGGVLPRATS